MVRAVGGGLIRTVGDVSRSPVIACLLHDGMPPIRVRVRVRVRPVFSMMACLLLKGSSAIDQ